MDAASPVDHMVLQGRRVLALRRAMAGHDGGIAAVPRRLRAVLQTGAWQSFQPHEGAALVQHADFAAFAHAAPPDGLGADVQLLSRLCVDDLTTLDLLDRATTRCRGAPPHRGAMRDDGDPSGVRRIPASQGNSRQYALRRLRTSYPALHRQVLSGVMSVHQAMVAAGMRRRTISLPIDGARAASIILRHFPPDQLVELTEALSQAGDRLSSASTASEADSRPS